MAPIADDPHRLILEGSQKHGHRLDDLERAEESAQHARAVGWKSRRWLWMTLFLVVAVVAVVAIYQFAAPSDVPLPGQ